MDAQEPAQGWDRANTDGGRPSAGRPVLADVARGWPPEAGAHPAAPRTALALFEVALRAHPARPALRFGGAALSYRALDEASRALAAWWRADGLERGDRVALMLPNRPAFVIAALAAWRAGAIVVPVDPRLPGGALRHQLGDAGARCVVVAEEFGAALEPVQQTLRLRRVLVAARGDGAGRWQRLMLKGGAPHQPAARGGWGPAGPAGLAGAMRLADALARGRGMALQAGPPRADDIALLQYTGGTTDHAKGAVLLHGQLAANVEQSASWFAVVPRRVPPDMPLQLLCTLPLHQIFGFTLGWLLAMRWAACMLLADGDDAKPLLAAARRRDVHVLPGTPATFEALLARPEFERVDWSSLQLALCGGMALPHAIARRWFERTGCRLVEGYGLAEASPAVTCGPLAERGEWRPPGQVGHPLPGTELRLLGDDDEPVAPDMIGEVVVRGPQVMAGYWQRPDETARVMTADGFLRTGDLGRLDAEGRLQLVERKDDLVSVDGFSVAPAEVEEVLARLPGVRECAVVGVSDARDHWALKAVLVRAEPGGPRPSEDDVRAFCETHLAGHQRPLLVEFRTELPKNALGVPLRRALRERVTPEASARIA
jgi:long-chain acyl-CoA synthetase